MASEDAMVKDAHVNDSIHDADPFTGHIGGAKETFAKETFHFRGTLGKFGKANASVNPMLEFVDEWTRRRRIAVKRRVQITMTVHAEITKARGSAKVVSRILRIPGKDLHVCPHILDKLAECTTHGCTGTHQGVHPVDHPNVHVEDVYPFVGMEQGHGVFHGWSLVGRPPGMEVTKNKPKTPM